MSRASTRAPVSSDVSGPIRVVLVEDNDIFRETLQLLFGLRDEIEVVGSVATGDEAAAALRGACSPTSC